MRFHIRWPNGETEACYSPSLVIRDYLVPGTAYPLDDFVKRSREALTIASDRVMARYGFPCSLARGQLQRIEAVARAQAADPGAEVTVLFFQDVPGAIA